MLSLLSLERRFRLAAHTEEESCKLCVHQEANSLQVKEVGLASRLATQKA
jgi:hypothetical protein